MDSQSIKNLWVYISTRGTAENFKADAVMILCMVYFCGNHGNHEPLKYFTVSMGIVILYHMVWCKNINLMSALIIDH